MLTKDVFPFTNNIHRTVWFVTECNIAKVIKSCLTTENREWNLNIHSMLRIEAHLNILAFCIYSIKDSPQEISKLSNSICVFAGT